MLNRYTRPKLTTTTELKIAQPLQSRAEPWRPRQSATAMLRPPATKTAGKENPIIAGVKRTRTARRDVWPPERSQSTASDVSASDTKRSSPYGFASAA